MNGDDKIRALISTLVEKIKTGYRPEKIILFGSYAWGAPTDDSDIDLLVVKPTSARPIDRRVQVRKIISDPERRVPIELVVLTPEEIRERLRIGDQFVEEIVEKGEVLYAA